MADRNGGDQDVPDNEVAAQAASARQYDWRPRPDPTVLTTQQLRETETSLNRTIAERVAGLRELIEQRLDGMDKATELLAERIGRFGPELQSGRELLRSEMAAAVLNLRELLEARLDAMDKANDLLAENVRQFPSDLDKATKALREVLQADIRNVQDVSQEKFSAIEGTFASNALALTAALAAQKEAAAEQNKSNTLAITKSEQATKETIAANAAQNTNSLTSQAATISDLKDRLVRLEAGGVATGAAHSERRLDNGQLLAVLGLILVAAGIIVTVLIATGH
jgi:hypothetical protein